MSLVKADFYVKGHCDLLPKENICHCSNLFSLWIMYTPETVFLLFIHILDKM